MINLGNGPWNPITQIHPSTGINPLCDTLQFLHVMERTGVVYSKVEKLSISGHMDGTVYRSVFLRTFNLKALTVTTAGGMNILKEYMQERYCQSLAWLHLERYSEPASELADWLELRKRCGYPLRRVIVSVHAMLHPQNNDGNWDVVPVVQESSTLDDETRRRIEAALAPGPSGRGKCFEWRSTSRSFVGQSVYEMASPWDEGEDEEARREELEAAAAQVGLTGETMQMVLDITSGATSTAMDTTGPAGLQLIDTAMADGVGHGAGSPVSPETPLPPISLSGSAMAMFSQSLADFDEDEEWEFSYGSSMWF